MEFAWDVLQIGLPMARRHGRLFHPELARVIDSGLAVVRDRFGARLREVHLPSTKFFRICDLLNGNDIPSVILGVDDGLQRAGRYTEKDDVPLEHFRLNIREPIHLHPGFRFGVGQSDGRLMFGLEIDLTGHMDVGAWRRQLGEVQKQLNEFQYQFAVTRESILGPLTVDSFKRALIQDFLSLEHRGVQSEYSVRVWTGFRSVLTGLHCWDLYKREGLKLDDAVDRTLDFYPQREAADQATGEENMRANYKSAVRRIARARARFTSQ